MAGRVPELRAVRGLIMKAIRIPRGQRILLIAGQKHVTRLELLRVLWLKRWAGELPAGGVLTAAGLAAGCCGHYSVFRWRILLHRHPGDRPVPADMEAALCGKAPVPEWFLRGKRP
jgi:hypothetical protein